MKKILNGCISAFAMYSIIPMPKIDFDKDNLAYTLCFLPFIGFFISILMLLLFYYSNMLGMSDGLFAALAIALPILITGGLHIDGYMDTIDAVSSRQEMPRRLEILKDSHVGAFGVIYIILYFIIFYGLLQQAYLFSSINYILFGFILSRILAVLNLLYLKPIKTSGLGYHFFNSSSKNITKFTMFFLLIICMVALLYLEGLTVFFVGIGCLILFLFYKSFTYKQFGGVSGDTSGFLILLIEIYFVATDVIVNLVK